MTNIYDYVLKSLVLEIKINGDSFWIHNKADAL